MCLNGCIAREAGWRAKKVKDLVCDGLGTTTEIKCETFVIGNRIEPSLWFEQTMNMNVALSHTLVIHDLSGSMALPSQLPRFFFFIIIIIAATDAPKMGLNLFYVKDFLSSILHDFRSPMSTPLCERKLWASSWRRLIRRRNQNSQNHKNYSEKKHQALNWNANFRWDLVIQLDASEWSIVWLFTFRSLNCIRSSKRGSRELLDV